MQLVLRFFMLFFPWTNVLANNWQFQHQNHEVKVFTRTGPNGQLWVKGQTELNSNLSALLVLLNDTRNSKLWIANNQSVEVLKRPAYHQAIVHSVFNAPWPVNNRDMITHSITRQDPESLQVTIQITNRGDQYPLTPSVVRMSGVTGQWEITPLDHPRIRIVYQGTAQAEGNIPLWLANQTLISSTFDTFVNLNQRLPQAAYQNKPIRGILESNEPSHSLP